MDECAPSRSGKMSRPRNKWSVHQSVLLRTEPRRDAHKFYPSIPLRFAHKHTLVLSQATSFVKFQWDNPQWGSEIQMGRKIGNLQFKKNKRVQSLI